MTAEDFAEVARECDLDVDLLIVGDGSGTRASTPCGWSCLMYDRVAGELSHHYGATSHGTNNFAELMPCLNALWAHQARSDGTPRTVGVVTDSEWFALCWDGTYERRQNLSLWAMLECFAAHGYTITVRHRRRNSNDLLVHADQFSRKMRKLAEEANAR